MRFAKKTKLVQTGLYLFVFVVGVGAGYGGCVVLRGVRLRAEDGVQLDANELMQTSTQQEASVNAAGKSVEQGAGSDLKVGIRRYDEKCVLNFEVAGAVVAPGVYCMNDGQLLDDVIKRAGGFYEDVYAFKFVSQHFNLAQEIVDGGKLYVPFENDVVCEVKPPADDPSSINDGLVDLVTVEKDLTDTGLKQALCVSLNNASSEELQELSGIGEVTAKKIIDGRPYYELIDLMNVGGIGEATFSKIEDDICL